MSIFKLVIKIVDKQYFRVLQTNYPGTIPCPVLGLFNLIVLVAAMLCIARADENSLEHRKDHNNLILVVLNKTNFLIKTSYKLSIYFLATPFDHVGQNHHYLLHYRSKASLKIFINLETLYKSYAFDWLKASLHIVQYFL